MPESHHILTSIKSQRAFSALSDVNKKYISEHSTIKSHTKGQFLWKKADPCDCCVFIIDGLIEIVSSNQDGNDRIIGLFGPGDVIGLSAILKRTNYPASALVSSPTSKTLHMYIRSIDSDLTVENKDNMLTWQRETLLIHEQILRDKITILGAGHVHLRLIELFDHLRLRFTPDYNPKLNKFIIPIPITKTQIAKVIEARVETVIRTLNKWEKAGHLKFDIKGVTVTNLDSLREKEGL